MFGFTKRRREFIVDEQDLIHVLKAINNNLHYLDGQVGNCGWGDGEESKWFVLFYANNRKFSQIIQDLNEIGEFKLSVRPKGKIDWCFSRKYLGIEAKKESKA